MARGYRAFWTLHLRILLSSNAHIFKKNFFSVHLCCLRCGWIENHTVRFAISFEDYAIIFRCGTKVTQFFVWPSIGDSHWK